MSAPENSKPSLRIPPWLRVKLPCNHTFSDTRALVEGLDLHTVCHSAKCPNMFECFSRKTATFLILGNTCTRNCAFCNIGGGIILDDAPARHKRNDAAVLSALAVRENGSGAERVLQALTALDTALPSAAQLAARRGLEETRLAPELDALLARGEAAAPLPGRFIASAVLDALWARCEALLTDYHAKNPLHAGIRAAELRQRLFRAVEPERADALLARFVREGKLRFAAERYALADNTVRNPSRQTAMHAELQAPHRAADLRPERTDRVRACFDAMDRAESERVLESLLTGGELIALAPRLCLHREVYVCACALVRAYFADHETLTLAAFRDLLGTSRDSALLVLECLDRNDRTRREGDLRRPGRRLYE